MIEIGKLVATKAVAETMEENMDFKSKVFEILNTEYTKGIWGDLSENDALMNDTAVKTGEGMILGKYRVLDESIYIITESDHSVTTILFPEEY